MKTLIINDSGESIAEDFLHTWVRDVAQVLKTRGVLPADKMKKELSLVFLREHDAKNLNWTHRQKDYATDILSFTSEDPQSFGELVMCPVVLQKQAKDHGVTIEHEMGYMVLHGVLHLLGFDHKKDEKDGEMMNLQDEVHQTLLEARKPKKKAKPAAKKAVTTKKAASKKPAKKAPKKGK